MQLNVVVSKIVDVYKKEKKEKRYTYDYILFKRTTTKIKVNVKS